MHDQRVNKKYVLPLAEYVVKNEILLRKFFVFFNSRFIHVTQENISIVLFDAHGSSGQDENYFKNNLPDWFERQYEDYIKVAQ